MHLLANIWSCLSHVERETNHTPEHAIGVSSGYAGGIEGELAMSDGGGVTFISLVLQRKERVDAAGCWERLDTTFITDSHERC